MSSNAATAWSRWQMPAMPEFEQPLGSSRAVVAGSTPEIDIAASRDEARRAGWEQGLSEGRQAARGELRLQAERWQQLLAHLSQPLSVLNAEVEQELAGLALAIARQVVQDELQARPEHILALVQQMVAALPAGKRQVRLRLHPEDAHLVADGIEMDSAGNSAGEPWQIIEDAAISRGGCLLESGSTRIDGRLETRLTDVVARLADDERHLRAVV